MNRGLALTAALLLAHASTALANGGPVAWSTPGGRGSLAPSKNTPVVLESEDLLLTLAADGNSFTARASYVLVNGTGTEQALTYGVPLTWLPEDTAYGQREREGNDPLAAKGAQDYPGSVVIKLNGKRQGCHVEGAKRIEPVFDPSAPFFDTTPRIEAWCVTQLVVPTGVTRLELAYPGSLQFVDQHYYPDAFLKREPRALNYLLAPAGSWAGTPKWLSVELAAGPWTDYVDALSPSGWERKGSSFFWRIDAPNLAGLGSVRAKLSSDQVLGYRERLNWAVGSGWRARGSADGTSGSARAVPELLAAGSKKPWCGVRIPGAWIELEGETAGDCYLKDMVILMAEKGVGASARSGFAGTSISLRACGDEGQGRVEVTAMREALPAFVDLHAAPVAYRFKSEAEAAWKTKARICVRATFLGDGGKKDTACVAAVRPVDFCPGEAPRR